MSTETSTAPRSMPRLRAYSTDLYSMRRHREIIKSRRTPLITPNAHCLEGTPQFLSFLRLLRHWPSMERVLTVFGGYSGPGLSTITHEEGSPWHHCYREGELGIRIPDHFTQEYYQRQLVPAGR